MPTPLELGTLAVRCLSQQQSESIHSHVLHSHDHVVGEPGFLALTTRSLFVVLAVITWPDKTKAPFWINLSTATLAVYSMYWLWLDLRVGALTSVVYLALWYRANTMVQREKDQRSLKSGTSLTYAAVIHVASWAFQVFVGHVIEGKKPTLFDSMFTAFSMAPMFVVYETLFNLGFMPQLQRNNQPPSGPYPQWW